MNLSIYAGQFLNRIWDAASICLSRPRSRVQELDRVAERLRVKLEDVDRDIDEAERNGQIATGETRLWKRQAAAFVSSEVANIQRDYMAMRCLGGWSWNCVSINRRVTKKLKEAHNLVRAEVPTFASRILPPPAVELPISNNVVGMQPDLIQIVNQIKDENIRVIGIYGMGGIGKTTLLNLINNHEEISKLKFEHVVWIVASKGCKLRKLQMDLAQNVGLNLKDDESEEICASKLFNFFKEKNCLLFLDDIWESYELFMLGMEQKPAKHGKEQKRKVVVFTTRSKQVCTGMRPNVKKKVEGLSSDQAWELFLKYAGEEVINSGPEIIQLAEEIAKKCTGVPLALISVGRAMSAKRSWKAWNDALTQLKQSQMPEVTGMKDRDPMFAAFKLSYDSLEDNTRACLLCCSLWPEDFEIEKVELIQCWIGLDLMDEFDSINKAFRQGHFHIETLTSACLLELVDNEGTTRIKMHGVIRDMALWMTSDCGSNQHRWIVMAQAGLRRLKLENEEWKVAERASFMLNHLSSLPRQTPTFPKLSMFMLQQNHELDLIPGPFFQSLPVLTFLDLSHTNIRELPREINMLSELQCLNLSFTPVKALPAELSSLAKLKYLLLERTYDLAKVPKGTISNLPFLKLLDLYESKYADLDELEGFPGCRKNIGITLHSMTDLERLGSLSQLSTWKLQLQNMTDLTSPSQLFESVMSSHNTRQDLERLEIVNVMTGGKLTITRSNDDHEECFECLRYMVLISAHDLQEITWKAVEPQTVFPYLHELNIFKCKMLRNITWVLQLPNLCVLRVTNCDEMEELISCVGSCANSSIGLRLLYLAGLPKLNCISQQPLTFPYLERLYVTSCPELKKLPLDAEICHNKLEGIFGQEDWWENIMWKDVNDKIALSLYFKTPKTPKTPTKKMVFRLDMKNAKARAKALKIVVGINGVVSAALDDNRISVVGDQVDPIELIYKLRRKNFGSVEFLSVTGCN